MICTLASIVRDLGRSAIWGSAAGRVLGDGRAKERAYDLNIAPTYRWNGDYNYYLRRVAPYKSEFIVHIGAASEDSTRIEVFQHGGRIIGGTVIGFSGDRGVLGFHQNRRMLAPTQCEACKLLDLIRTAIKQSTRRAAASIVSRSVSASRSDYRSRNHKPGALALGSDCSDLATS